jgi:hypothetical protein
LQVRKKGREKRDKGLEENLYVTFNENSNEMNRQNIDVKETELKNLRDVKIKG